MWSPSYTSKISTFLVFLQILTIRRFELFSQEVATIHKQHFSGIQEILRIYNVGIILIEKEEKRHVLLMKAFKT